MNADMDRDVIGRLLLLGAYLRSLRVHLWFHFPLGSHRPSQALGEH
jgi:hypothetical protein